MSFATRVINSLARIIKFSPTYPTSIPILARHLLSFQRRNQRRFLVLRPQLGAGDLLCLLAALPNLKQSPHDWIMLAVDHSFIPLARLAGAADLVVPIGSLPHLISRFPALNFIRKIPLLPDEQSPARPRQLINLIAEFSIALGVDPILRPVRLKVTPAMREGAKARFRRAGIPTNRPIFVIHCGPSWAVKHWPADSWTKLVQRLMVEFDATVIQIGHTTAVFDSSRSVGVPGINGALNWCNKLSVLETVSTIQAADCFIGIDSGPWHIAQSVGTPAVGLFGPTAGQCFIHPESFAASVSSEIACIGCHHNECGPLHWRSNCHFQVACMEHLSVESVVEAIFSVSRIHTISDNGIQSQY